MRRPSPSAWAVLPAGAALFAFAPALANGFVNWDDPGNIVRNPFLGRFDPAALKWAVTTSHYGHFQPLAWLSLSLDQALWGGAAAGFHMTAIFLHAAAGAALFFVLRALLRVLAPHADEEWSALSCAVAAALWAVHPLRVEAVAWATERRELLATLFQLLAVNAYLRAVEKRREHPALGETALWFAAACLSKVTACLLPFVLLSLDRWILGRGWRVREKAWLLGGAALTLALGVRAQNVSGTTVPVAVFGIADRVAQALFGPGYYLIKTGWPAELSPFVYVDWRNEPERWVPVAAATCVLAVTLAFLWRRFDGAKAAVAALALTLAPSLGFFKSGPQTAADRFAHAPSLVLAAALAWLLANVPRRSRAPALGACALAAAAFGVMTNSQCRVWRDSTSLWTRAAQLAPPTPLVLQNLGAALREAGREEEASSVFRRLAAVDPESPAALSLKGDALVEKGDYKYAEVLYARAVWLDPSLSDVRVNLGVVYLRQGKKKEAERALVDAVTQNPKSAFAWHNLGVARAALGKKPEARAAYEKALRLEPGRADTRAELRKL